MVEVAVIGAGAAGLVACRHLLKCGLRPIVFERSRAVGGTWQPHNQASFKLWDSLQPNLSKYTCVFSELLWDETTPSFPTHTQLQTYLQDYAETFVTPTQTEVRFGCTVTKVTKLDTASSSTSTTGDDWKQLWETTSTTTSTTPNFQHERYQLEWRDERDQLQQQEFDRVIVATGFFAQPVLSEGLTASSPQIIHSSQYRSPLAFAGKTVAVIGSSFSALEIAANVRQHAQHVVNIVSPNHIPWVLPRHVLVKRDNNNNNGGMVAPLDVVLYQRSQPADAVREMKTTLNADDIAQRHALLHSLGSPYKQQLAFSQLPNNTTPPHVAISDDYLNLVVDGSIQIQQGRFVKATSAEDNEKLDVHIQRHDDTTITISNMDSIIACTGYQCELDTILDQASILQPLQYTSSATKSASYAPMALCWDTFHPALPGLGFVGMYKGPYWGVMELQAQLLAALYSGQSLHLTTETIQHALDEAQTIQSLTTNPQLTPQFPRHDYAGFMDALARPLNLIPQADKFGAKGCMVSPPFYQPDETVARQWKEQIDRELGLVNNDDTTNARGGSANSAKIALAALIGEWSFDRTITQFNMPDAAPQRVTGTIVFSHIPPSKTTNSTSDYSDKTTSLIADNNQHQRRSCEWDTALYDETGLFEIMPGKTMDVFRQYEYQVKDNGILEIFFVELGKRAHLFLSLQFVSASQTGVWVATSDHLCIKDLYKAHFEIQLDSALSATTVTMTYRVRGPAKDYESITRLTRPKITSNKKV